MSGNADTASSHKARSPPQAKYKLMSELPFNVLKRLADRLDVPTSDGKDPLWRKMIEVMPDSPYEPLAVERFGMNANHKSGSPAYALLTDMSNRGFSYDKLVSLLKELNHLTALVELGYREDVRFVQNPIAAPAILGKPFELRCKAVGVPPPDYLWFKERVPLKEHRSPVLRLDKVGRDDEGSYCCRATNGTTVVFSSWAEVHVHSPPVILRPIPDPDVPQLPQILQQPTVLTTVAPGQELRLVVVAEGPSMLNYQWYHNGHTIQYGASNELYFEQARPENEGDYCCGVSSDGSGSILSNIAQVKVVPHDVLLHPIGQLPPFPRAQQSDFSPPPLPPSSQSLFHGPPAMPAAPSPTYSQSISGTSLGHLEELYGALPGPPSHDSMYNMASLETYRSVHGGSAPPTSLPMFPGPTDPKYYSPPGAMEPEDIPGPQGGAPEPGRKDMYTWREPVADLSKACYDKVALLVGNKKYRTKLLQLNTPESDTQDLAGILLSAGFKVVSLVNLTKEEMEQAVNYFLSLLGKNVYALFYFAGHGFEVKNMNYMMPVEAAMSKNPADCLCAQQVLELMQNRGTKLSVVLLDMCRVPSQPPPQVPSVPGSLYEGPFTCSNGFFVYGFSCSHTERAFEPGQSLEAVPEDERENSIFVSAIKKRIKEGCIRDSIEVVLAEAARAVYERGRRDGQTGLAWQRPEVRHNLGEPLSLWDPVAPSESDADSERRARAGLWQEAHCVPATMVLMSEDCKVVLRLHFRSEHSNVLIVTAELLNGCYIQTRISNMYLELIPDTHPYLRLKSEVYSVDSKAGKSHQKDLMHFRIPDLQKIPSPTVTLFVNCEYYFEKADETDDPLAAQGEKPPRMTTLRAPIFPPPLYAKVVADPTFQQLHTQFGYLAP